MSEQVALEQFDAQCVVSDAAAFEPYVVVAHDVALEQLVAGAHDAERAKVAVARDVERAALEQSGARDAVRAALEQPVAGAHDEVAAQSVELGYDA